MKTRITLLLLAFLLLVGGCSTQKYPAVTSETTNTSATTLPPVSETSETAPKETLALPFWTVTDPATGAKIYLFGSIHAAKAELYPMPAEIEAAYNAAAYLAVEVNIITAEQDMSLLVRSMEKMIYPNGSTISSHISPALYDEAKAFLTAEGIYNITFDYMMPVMWATTLQSLWVEKSTLQTSLGVDRHFLDKAMKDGKIIVELESVEAQYDMLASFSPPLQELFLASALESPAAQVQELEDLYDVWLQGDLDQIEALSTPNEGESTKEEQALLAEYTQKLLHDRNLPMAQRAEAFLREEKSCFFIVGAAHMAGETGIIAYLTQKGYEITR